MSGAGHNSFAGRHLRSFVERIERLDAEEAEIKEAKREVYAELKSAGFDPKITRQVLRARKMDQNDRQEQEALFALYWNAVHGPEASDGTVVATHARDAREEPAPDHDPETGEIIEPGEQPAGQAYSSPPSADAPSRGGSSSEGAPAGASGAAPGRCEPAAPPPSAAPTPAPVPPSGAAEATGAPSPCQTQAPRPALYAQTLSIDDRIKCDDWPKSWSRNAAVCASCGEEVAASRDEPAVYQTCGCRALSVWGGDLILGRAGEHTDRSRANGRRHPLDLALALHDAGMAEEANADDLALGLEWRASSMTEAAE